MGRNKVSVKNKAFTTTMSIKPIHADMLEYLQTLYSMDKSSTIQLLIEEKYTKEKGIHNA